MATDLSIRKIRGFAMVAELRSFRLAAEKLHISASALSMNVRELEETLGVSLLRRTTRMVEPTAHGVQFLARIQQVLANLDTIVQDFKGETVEDIPAETDLRGSRLTIACTPTIVNRVLLDAMESFHERYPGAAIQLLDVGSRGIINALRTSEAELGIGPFNDLPPEFESEPFMEDPFVAVVPRNHALATKQTVEFAELLAYPFICLKESHSVRRTLEQAAAKAGLDFAPAYELLYFHSVWGLVRAGLGVTAIPTGTVPQLPAEGLRTIPCTSAELTRTICIIRRKGEKTSPAVHEFLILLRDGKRRISGSTGMPGGRGARRRAAIAV